MCRNKIHFGGASVTDKVPPRHLLSESILGRAMGNLSVGPSLDGQAAAVESEPPFWSAAFFGN